MRRSLLIKSVTSIIAIICNVALFCLLIYQVFKNLPTVYEIYIPVVLGLFLILNVVAITLALRAYKGISTEVSLSTKGSKVRLIGLAIAVFACLGLGFWLGFRSHDPIESWKWQRAKKAKAERFIGKKASDFVAQTPDGNEWRLQDHLGKVVLIDFWATWCGPCVGSMLKMKEIYEKYKSRDDFVMVGISVDHDKQALLEFCQKQGIAWTQLFEENKGWENTVARAFDIRGIPSVWVINKEGNVIGMDLHSSQVEEIEGIIEKSLNNKQNISD